MLRRLHILKDPLKSARLLSDGPRLSNSLDGQNSPTSSNQVESKGTISKAMKAYLERAQTHDEFMKTQKYEFEIGKRHLANMMGENIEAFTQEDVDNAIQYLFPSGLYQKKARPLMKPPEDVFPQRKAAEFDQTGRPYHFLFYTGRPNFYQLLHTGVQHINDLYKFEDSMNKKQLVPDPNLILDLSGSQWMDKQALELKLVEPLLDKEHDSFVNLMERLLSLPYSYKYKDFILEYRKPLVNQSKSSITIKPQVGEDGREFVTVYECRRKRAIGNVTLKLPGTGCISINGKDINYFEGIQQREQDCDCQGNFFVFTRMVSSFASHRSSCFLTNMPSKVKKKPRGHIFDIM